MINDRWSWSSNHYDDDHWCEHVRCAGREKLDDDNVLEEEEEEEEEEEDHWCEHVRCAGQEKPTTCSPLSPVERQLHIQNSDQYGNLVEMSHFFQLVRLSMSSARSFLSRWPTPSGWWPSLRWCWCWSSQCCWCSIQCWRLPTLRLQCKMLILKMIQKGMLMLTKKLILTTRWIASLDFSSHLGPPLWLPTGNWARWNKPSFILSLPFIYLIFVIFTITIITPQKENSHWENCHSRKGYKNFPIWQFVFENCHIIYIIFIEQTKVLVYLSLLLNLFVQIEKCYSSRRHHKA